MAVGTVGFNPVPEVPDTTPPVISSLTPATLTVDTPTTVTVTGTGFNASDKVYQDEGQMTTIFVSDTELTFQALASSAGIVDITVQGDGGTSPAIQMTVT